MENKFALCTTKKIKYSNSNPPFKLNGRSLISMEETGGTHQPVARH